MNHNSRVNLNAGPCYQCTVGTGKVYCPNSSLLGYQTRYATPGMFIAWETEYQPLGGGELTTHTEYGRVLGKIVDHGGRPDVDCVGHLAVLHFICDFTACAYAWVDPKRVTGIRPPPVDFMAFMLGVKMTPDFVTKLDKTMAQGAVSNSYFKRYLVEL